MHCGLSSQSLPPPNDWNRVLSSVKRLYGRHNAAINVHQDMQWVLMNFRGQLSLAIRTGIWPILPNYDELDGESHDTLEYCCVHYCAKWLVRIH